MNQIINMFMRIVIRKLMNKGVGKGIDMLSSKQNSDERPMSKAERQQMRRNRQQMRQAKQAARLARRTGRL